MALQAWEPLNGSGGISIVQEPADAEFDDMPRNVINRVDVDYRVPATDIPYVIQDLSSKPSPAEVLVPDDVKLEVKITERMNATIDELTKIGSHSDYSCPDCGGDYGK